MRRILVLIVIAALAAISLTANAGSTDGSPDQVDLVPVVDGVLDQASGRAAVFHFHDDGTHPKWEGPPAIDFHFSGLPCLNRSSYGPDYFYTVYYKTAAHGTLKVATINGDCDYGKSNVLLRVGILVGEEFSVSDQVTFDVYLDQDGSTGMGTLLMTGTRPAG